MLYAIQRIFIFSRQRNFSVTRYNTRCHRQYARQILIAMAATLWSAFGMAAVLQTGKSFDTSLISPRTGETIYFTVHEPDQLGSGERRPLILRGKGFGQSRDKSRQAVQDYLDAGFGVISFEQRGFGDSNARVSIMDPDTDAQNVIQILDWAEQHLNWLEYKNGKLRLGTSGRSYGGGFQLALLGADPKARVQAMVPQITWHDLSYSLAPGNVAKSDYLGLLTTAMFNGAQNGYEHDISEMLGRSLLTNSLLPNDADMLRYRSARYFCDGVQRAGGVPVRPFPKVDVLFMQGMYDVLFNVNEAVKNYQCLSKAGGDVRLMTYPVGHVLPSSLTGLEVGIPSISYIFLENANKNPNISACGARQATATEIAWFKAKLMDKPEEIQHVPRVCIALDANGDHIEMDRVPMGGSRFDVDRTLVNPTASGLIPVAIPLYTTESSKVIAGIPQARIQLRGVSGALSELGAPIVFLGIGRRNRLGAIEAVGDQVQPVRGWGEHTIDLNGIGIRASKDETIYLLVYGAHPQFLGSSTRFSSLSAVISGSVNLPVDGGTSVTGPSSHAWLQTPIGALPAIKAPKLPSLPAPIGQAIKGVLAPAGEAAKQLSTVAAGLIAKFAPPVLDTITSVTQSPKNTVATLTSTVTKFVQGIFGFFAR